MITVRLYGLLRLDSGIKEEKLEAENLRELYSALESLGIDGKSLKGSLVLVNGKPAAKRTKFNDGDIVQLMPPVAGG